jgi:LPXTG-site transpeptidase (sortase) family protein
VARLRAAIPLVLVAAGSIAVAYPALSYGLNGHRAGRLTTEVAAAIERPVREPARERARPRAAEPQRMPRRGFATRRPTGATSEPSPVLGGRPILEVPAPRDGQALGVIQIPSIGLNSVFLEGTASATLLVGPGHLPWTAMPGTGGVSILAAHRDLQFSDLHAVGFGDRVWLQLPSGTSSYRIVDVHVTTPDDPGIYDPDPDHPTELRLLTCWPPAFVGPAPDRLVVSAVPADPQQAAGPAPPSTSPAPAAQADGEHGSGPAPTAPPASTTATRTLGGAESDATGPLSALPSAPSAVTTELIPMVGAAGVGLSSLASFAAVASRRRRSWFLAFLAGAAILDAALVLGLRS